MSGVSEAFVAALDVITSIDKRMPLPKEIVSIEKGDWKLSINASGQKLPFEGREPLDAFCLFVENTRFIVFGILDPTGGLIGGMSEDEFITQMKALVA